MTKMYLWVVNAVELTTIRQRPGDVLPAQRVALKVGVQQGVPEVLHPPAPWQLENLDEEA